jgi:DNA repair exonuclease SbcCD ATPase subunit
MSSGAAPKPGSPQRTIGEILLAHGYVDQEQLDKAVERQRETGFPLGQILVEAGAITRLELASALAVQWSDMPIAVRLADDDRRSLTTEDGAERKAIIAPAIDPAWQDELNSSMRALGTRLEQLETSMVDLERRDGDELARRGIEKLESRLVLSEELLAETARRSAESVTPESLEERLGTLVAALETALARADELEAGIAPLTTRIEQIAASADRTSAELERRSSGFTDVINALSRRLEERSSATLSELRAAIESFAARPAADPSLSTRVDELAHRIEAVPDATQLEELNRVVATLSERPSADPLLAARVEQLAHRLEQLAARPSGEPGLADRVAALAARVDAGPDAFAYQEVSRQVSSLLEKPSADPAIGARVDALEHRAAELSELVHANARDQTSGELEAVRARLGMLEEATAQLDELVDRVARLTTESESRRDPSPELEGRLAEQSKAPDSLAERLAEATHSWTSDRAALEHRLAELAARIDRTENTARALPAATMVPGASQQPDASAADDLNRLWFAVERISLQLTEHHRDIDQLLASGQSDGRLEELAARLDDLEDRGSPSPAAMPAGDGGQTVAGDGGAGARALARKLGELEKSAKAEREKLLTQIEQMLGSFEWRLQRLESTGAAAPPLGS